MPSPLTPIARFWSKVNKDGPVPAHKPDLGPCWVWTGSCNHKGYGQLISTNESWQAHRFAFYMSNGNFPSELHILHKCDNPPCVRPDHLYAGTNIENVLDRVQFDRSAKKLTKEVIEIRRLAEIGITQSEIVRMLNLPVGRSQISFIVNRKTWAHV